MSNSITIHIKPRGEPISRLPSEVQIASDSTLSDLYKALATKTNHSLHRLRLTKGSDNSFLANTATRTISSTSLRNNSTVFVKDLGPQIAWRTVFIIEYIGPLLIHPIALYLTRPYLYRNAPASPSHAQEVFMWTIVLHFAKRELETLLVHRFSNATMPARNLFKNSAHYWLLAGLNLAYWVYAPTSPAAADPNPLLFYFGLVLFALGELGNLNTHLTLRSLRSDGGTERGIPRGLGFGWVSCPNYLFEIVAWTGIWLVSGLSWSVLLFIVLAAGQMGVWAKKRERKLRQEFGDKYKKKRYAMVPGIY